MALLWATTPASAEPPSAADDDADTAQALARVQRFSRPLGLYGRVSTALTFGRGLRFNNPYRLRTELGDSAESVSLTASYTDVAVAMVFGEPEGLQHGGVLHLTFALEGVPQQAISASYMLAYRGAEAFSVYGRLGPSLLIAPDSNIGGELAAGGAYMVTGALGITAEIVGNLYYGAGTYSAQYTVVPILSAQAGIIADFEVLP